MNSKNAARKIATAAVIISAMPFVASKLTLPAAGADFGQPPPAMIPADRVEFATNWYVRGDIAYVQETSPQIESGFTFWSSPSMRSTFSAGAGMGYKFNDWFRADVVADYRAPVHAAGVGAPGACFALTGASFCTVDSVLNGWEVLVNGYLDLGTWNGFTPYIGAGAGVASSQIKQTVAAIINNVPFEAATTSLHYRFAWAAMAGVAFAMTEHLQFDLGYRFLNLGSVPVVPILAGVVGTKTVFGHELRGGLRYTID